MNTSFWYNDHTVLFDKDSLIEFFPSNDYTFDRKLNAIFRASIYASVLMSVYSNNPKWVSIMIIGAIITILLHNGNKIKSKSEKVEGLENTSFNKGPCTEPTKDNPFMNYTISDLMNVDENLQVRDKPVSCSVIDNPTVKDLSENAYHNNLYRDVDDVYGRNLSTRQFYTMPNTGIVNAQTEFAEWCFKTPKTCKEDTENCMPYDDLRAKRPVQVDEESNPVNTESRMSRLDKQM
jgi:hypothetical protein